MPDVKDPVCGMEFPEETAQEMGATHATHKGKRRWFCSPACEREFRADPEKYAG